MGDNKIFVNPQQGGIYLVCISYDKLYTSDVTYQYTSTCAMVYAILLDVLFVEIFGFDRISWVFSRWSLVTKWSGR